MNKFISILIIVVLCSANFVDFRARTITGTVKTAEGEAIPGVSILVKGTTIGTVTDAEGKYLLEVPVGNISLLINYIGYITQEVLVENKLVIDITLIPDVTSLSEIVVIGYGTQQRRDLTGSVSNKNKNRKQSKASGNIIASAPFSHAPLQNDDSQYNLPNTEDYDVIHENIFLESSKNPLSTFSIDVDKASYSNVRRMLNNGQMPPKDAVRIEEMINYFDYDYLQPIDRDPFAIHTEVSNCPWNEENKLIHIGLQGKIISQENLPASNLVFLIDVSGSMEDPTKIPLLKSAFSILVDQLRPQDKVSIVVYAGAAGLVLEPTSGNKKDRIKDALEKLHAGGSTAGGEGILLAYDVAQKNFIKEGNNRIIIATDGDFNVGVSNNGELERLIEKKKETGVFLSVLGFGMGNYKDNKMETIADKGNGNYAYIDNMMEARKVFVNEFGGTLFTIAKDVKIQIEFNPAKIKAYRLVGYENRALKNEDFNNDKKDAGELGSGHTVTALYEIIPADNKAFKTIQKIDSLKYQTVATNAPASSNELMTLKFRYKAPDGVTSKLIIKTLTDNKIPFEDASDNFKFSAAVAEFGMILRDSEFKNKSSFAQIIKIAEESKGRDKEGYRSEFISLVKSCILLAKK